LHECNGSRSGAGQNQARDWQLKRERPGARTTGRTLLRNPSAAWLARVLLALRLSAMRASVAIRSEAIEAPSCGADAV
jgi:hypothetical protein